MNDELASMLPMIAAGYYVYFMVMDFFPGGDNLELMINHGIFYYCPTGLSSILFALTVDSDELNIVRPVSSDYFVIRY